MRILLGQFAYVYAECSFVELSAGQALADEVIAWLRERGFKFCGMHNMDYDRYGRSIQGDFLFTRFHLSQPHNFLLRMADIFECWTHENQIMLSWNQYVLFNMLKTS